MRRTLLLGALMLAAGPLAALDLDARLEWSRRVVLGTVLSGMVEAVLVRPGERVAAGAPLVRLDDREPRARAARARAQLALGQARLEEARREEQRARELYDRTVLSDHELQLAEIGRLEAQVALAEARERLVRAEVALDYGRVRAPFAGLVVSVDAEPGQMVVSGLRAAPLVTLASDRPMVASAAVSAEQATALGALGTARVGLGGAWSEGRVIGLAAEPGGSGGYRLRVAFTPPTDRRVAAGLPAVIRVELGEEGP